MGEYFTYIISCDNRFAIPVKSPLNFVEFERLYRERYFKLDPVTKKTIFYYGGIHPKINPKIMSVADFIETLPQIFEG